MIFPRFVHPSRRKRRSKSRIRITLDRRNLPSLMFVIGKLHEQSILGRTSNSAPPLKMAACPLAPKNYFPPRHFPDHPPIIPSRLPFIPINPPPPTAGRITSAYALRPKGLGFAPTNIDENCLKLPPPLCEPNPAFGWTSRIRNPLCAIRKPASMRIIFGCCLCF